MHQMDHDDDDGRFGPIGPPRHARLVVLALIGGAGLVIVTLLAAARPWDGATTAEPTIAPATTVVRPAVDGRDATAVGTSAPGVAVTTTVAGPVATVTIPAGTGADCGRGATIGDVLVGGFFRLLPDDNSAQVGRTYADDGALLARRTGARWAVEVRWPGSERHASDLTRGSGGPGAAAVSVVPQADGGPRFLVAASPQPVAALQLASTGSIATTDACRYMQFTVLDGDAVVTRFTLDTWALPGS